MNSDPDMMKCPECHFGWIASSVETHAEGCPRIHNPEMKIRFSYHKPTTEQAETYLSIRDRARSFAIYLMLNVPESRERGLAITKLEEAVMWANAGIARRS